MTPSVDEKQTRLNLLEVLRPKPSPVEIIRIGGNNDGAYLLPNDFKEIKACFSPGVSNRKDFEDELFDRFGIVSHMCDFSSDIKKLKTPLKPGQTFKKKWLDINGDANSITLEEWVLDLAPNQNDDLILQIDIEGAEYRNLLNTPDYIIKRFRIIVIELHGLSVFNYPDKLSKDLGPLLVKLSENFGCVHAHPNNCCGEFVVKDSNLNLPWVHELTLLRLDRWGIVNPENWFQPMLPHPLDIPYSVPHKEPIFLNENWLFSGARASESNLKVLSDKNAYLERVIKNAPHQEDVGDLYQLIKNACLSLPNFSPKPVYDQLVDLAFGKFFKISSQRGPLPRGSLVINQCPFFFHTQEGRNQSITIDLGSVHQLFELCIANRTDTQQQRANYLLYCLHDKPDPDFTLGYAVSIDKGFLSKENKLSVTDLRGAKSRYLTIFTPVKTVLHFSAIKIMGLPK